MARRRVGGTGRARSRASVAIAVSVSAHLGVVVLLALLLGQPREAAHRGSYVFLSEAEPLPEPPRAEQRAETPTPAKSASPARPRAEHVPPASTPAPVSELSATLPVAAPGPLSSDEDRSASLWERAGAEGSAGPLLGEPSAPSSTMPSPECLDGVDNDGDRLTDHEDPGCWPELPPEELVSKRTGALLLSDLRRDDLPSGDPDALGRARVEARLRPEGDDLVFRDGSFVGRIGPDGEVSFGRQSTGRLEFDLDGPRGPGYLRRKHFLDATEEIREARATASRERVMKTSLARLGADLDGIWNDRSLSLGQKRRILFERLDECDLEAPGGREAARTIVEFIRSRFRSRTPLAPLRQPERG